MTPLFFGPLTTIVLVSVPILVVAVLTYGLYRLLT